MTVCSIKSFLPLVAALAALPWANSASILLQGGTIISFKEDTQSLEIVRNGSVLITNDRIASITADAPASLPDGVEIVDATGKIISPGFVDTHSHHWQTAFRTIASNTTLADYIQKYGEFSPAKTFFTPEDVYLSQLVGIYGSLYGGVTSTLSHAHHTFSPEHALAGLQGSIDSGARVWWGYAIHNIGTNFTIEKQYEDLTQLAKNKTLNKDGGLVSVALAYDGLSVGTTQAEFDAARYAFQIASDLNLSAITAHDVGDPWLHASSISNYNNLGLLNSSIPLVFSHSSDISHSEAVLLRRFDQYISITPESESHYGMTSPKSDLIMDQGSLGIDTHFTYSGDILTQARLWLQAVRYKHYTVARDDWRGVPSTNPMSVQQAFFLATRNGALALGRDDLGVLKAGAKADILLIDATGPSIVGFSDPVAALILHANVGDIKDILVDGQWTKRNGSLVNADWEETSAKFKQSAARIQEKWKNTDWPPLVGQYATYPLFDYATTDRMDVQRGTGDGY